MPRDKAKTIERARRYRAKKHAERYGSGAGDMRSESGTRPPARVGRE